MCNFLVRNQETGAVFTVFHIRVDANGDPRFLLYDDGEWLYCASRNYAPLNANRI